MNSSLKCIEAREEFFEGAVPFEHGDGTILPWRLEVDKQCLYVDEALLDKGKCSVGVRLRVRTDAKLLGDSDAKLMLDECHPTTEGYELMGRRFVDKIFDPIAERYPHLKRKNNDTNSFSS